MSERLFISSVQKEFAAERRALRDFVRSDPLLKRFFDVVLFEDGPATGRSARTVYLDEVDRCAVYVGLLGQDYGFEDAEGVSPTEREFDRASEQRKERLVFIKGLDDDTRHPKMKALIRKADAAVVRRRFTDTAELTHALAASLVDYLERRGVIQARPFEERPCPGAGARELDSEAVAQFVRRARHERHFPLPENSPIADVLAHLNLGDPAQPSHAALLLFGGNPQRCLPSAEVRCMHFHGTEVQRPAPSYQIFKGNVFAQVDRATDFVLSVLSRRVGTRAESTQAPVDYELPPEVVREAIVNAVAHRDYAAGAAVQVSVFADRIEVRNPGVLLAPLTPARLRRPHSSIARNPRLCEALFLARYIEKYGTGTLMMIRESREHALPEPEFAQDPDEFVLTLWRDAFPEKRLAALDLSDRQRLALAHVKQHGRITNAEHQKLSGATRKTATRDLADLVAKGVLERKGDRRATTYHLSPQ